MTVDSETSSCDTKIKDNRDIKKFKMLYLGLMCFVTNCLSTIALEAGSRGSLRSTSPTRFAVYNNLLRRNYNLRIKVIVTNVLAAFISTVMLAIGDVYGVPYLYLPWLVNTIEGIAFYEGPTLFGLAYTMLPNANIPAGFFIFITLLIYVEELCIWKDVFMNFECCWAKYNRDKMLETKRPATIAEKELCGKNKKSLDVVSKKSNDEEQEPINVWSEFINRNTTDFVTKSMENNFSAKNCRRRLSFTEVTG
ncbi:uncharacterized protein LOC116850243 [Odontomachus brunneus]|uniref:uncharacterized protein LOC116850243 n=1 Tax=Odontomachus brunneus TaxID=486640 RepID=UPI0013F230B5|nr:uncharacterized protein LOC116850243 [Odontomachus brunneus]